MERKNKVIVVILISVFVCVLLISSFLVRAKNYVQLEDDDTGEHQLYAYFGNNNAGLVSSYEPFWSYTSYKVYRDHTIEIETAYKYLELTFESSCTETMDDEDYKALQKYIRKLNKKTADSDSCDGDDWLIQIYDVEDKEIYRSAGYIYGDKNMEQNIIPLLDKYTTLERPVIPSADDMPGFKSEDDISHPQVDVEGFNPAEQLYFVQQDNYDSSGEYYSKYELYYDGTIVYTYKYDDEENIETGMISEENLKYMQYYEQYVSGLEDSGEDSKYWTYTFYDEAGNPVTSDIFNEDVHGMLEMIHVILYGDISNP